MQKIVNPFIHSEARKEYHCFGCSPFNEIGLQLQFWEDGEELIAKWKPRKSLEGWMGVLHGGIQATLMDELAGWIVMIKMETAGVTAGMNINYKKPVLVSKGELTVRGRLESVDKRLANISCSLYDSEGTECASAELTYFHFPKNIAKERYYYPGKEAFYEE